MAILPMMATKTKSGPGKASSKGRSARGRTTTHRPGEVRPERYTPPVPKQVRSSPRWMGALIIVLFLIGVLAIILNYADILPGGVDNWWLVGAIASIFAGLMVATRYR